MKITIATGIYPPDIGGPATYSKTLFDELPKRGIETEVVSFGEVRHLPKGISHISYFFKLLRRVSNSDLIFAQDPVSVGLPALLVAVFLRKKFILKIVGDYAWEQGTTRYFVTTPLDDFSKEHRGYPFFIRFLKLIQALVARGADRIIVPSKYLKKIVSNWGVSKEKIFVVYNSFDHNDKIFKESAPSPADEKIIVSVGRLVPWKGFITLISIIPRLIKHFPGIKLIIAGDGPERRNIENAVRNIGLESNIFLTGGLSKEKLFKYIKSADVFVLNTSYEGFSHQLLEVMALGTPIITTTAGGNSEIIKNEENGILVAPDDRGALQKAIERILVDEELAKKFSIAGKKTVSFFTVERMINETIKVLSI
ncbi:MAG: glycosyltransferase family 4 protein [Patescibacteria group bacterium]